MYHMKQKPGKTRNKIGVSFSVGPILEGYYKDIEGHPESLLVSTLSHLFVKNYITKDKDCMSN